VAEHLDLKDAEVKIDNGHEPGWHWVVLSDGELRYSRLRSWRDEEWESYVLDNGHLVLKSKKFSGEIPEEGPAQFFGIWGAKGFVVVFPSEHWRRRSEAERPR